ncbi:MAG: hypothetical protein C0436_00570 [Alphaproteobacteria bacterium]|nr:hypothetical protein [Alphaproteobacteria bacterium]
MTAMPFTFPIFKAFTTTGTLGPLAGGLLHTFEAGTSTPLAVFQDDALTTPHTNPVVLDSNGQATIYLGSNAYKMRLEDSTGAVQPGWPIDNIEDQVSNAKSYTDTLRSDLASSPGSSMVGFIQSSTGAVARTVQEKGRDTLSVFDWLSDTERADVASRTGSLDVSANVLAAHTAAALTGKTIIFPAGVYGWATASTIPTAPQWEGEGVANLDSTGQVSQGAVILCKVTTGDYAVKIDPGANPFAAGFSIKGIKFKGDGTAKNGMTIKNVGNDGHFSNVTWDNFLENGLDCDYAQDVIFDDCTWYKSGQTAGSYGLTIRGGSNLLTFNRPRIEHCIRGHRITGGCFGIQFNDPHFELGDYGGVNVYNDYYTDPPFIIDATGGICSGVKYKGGWLVPASVQTLMDHYTITADNTAYLFSSTDCQDLSFDGVTFIHGSKGGKFLKVVSTQRDYMATVDGCTFNRPDCRIAAVDIQEGIFSNNQIHIYDNQTTDIFKFGLFSYCLVDGNKIDCTNPASTAKTSGYVFEAYGDVSVFNKRSLLGMNSYYYDKGYKFANSQWACSPSAQCPVKAVGFAPTAGVYDLELYRDGTIFQPGTVTITAINNAKQGQVVKIMGVGGGNPTVTNTASILLKGGINAGPLAANNILTLQEIDGDGKLYEIARNF